jgi:hypothetical protein
MPLTNQKKERKLTRAEAARRPSAPAGDLPLLFLSRLRKRQADLLSRTGRCVNGHLGRIDSFFNQQENTKDAKINPEVYRTRFHIFASLATFCSHSYLFFFDEH